VVIFLAGDLYHKVGEWRPSDGVSMDGITPGRIGHAFFSPQSALDVLSTKSPQWRNSTLSGFWPDARAFRKANRKKKGKKKARVL
jgi:hypothetical protein